MKGRLEAFGKTQNSQEERVVVMTEGGTFGIDDPTLQGLIESAYGLYQDIRSMEGALGKYIEGIVLFIRKYLGDFEKVTLVVRDIKCEINFGYEYYVPTEEKNLKITAKKKAIIMFE